MPFIELHRKVVGYESAGIYVDDKTMCRIEKKTITREELNDLFQDSDDISLDVTESDYPDSVYAIKLEGHSIVYNYEDLPE